MDDTQKGIVVLSIVGILLITFIPRSFKSRDHSDKDIYDACLEIHSRCEEMSAKKAPIADWVDHRDASLPKLVMFADDIELHLDEALPESQILYQVARHELPKSLQRQKARDVGESLAKVLWLMEAPTRQAEQDAHRRSQPSTWDPVVVVFVIIDLLLITGGLIYYFRKT